MHLDSEAFKTRLIKFLNLTSSDSDGEALSAIRFANTLLKKSGATWEILLADEEPVKYRAKPPPQQPAPTRVHVVDENQVPDLIDFIRENAWHDFDFEFLDSIEEQYELTQELKWKQMNALKNIYTAVRSYAERR